MNAGQEILPGVVQPALALRPGSFGSGQGRDHPQQEVGRDPRVGITHGDKIASGPRDPQVQRRRFADAPRGGVDDLHRQRQAERFQNLKGAVCGSVIDDHDLIAGSTRVVIVHGAQTANRRLDDGLFVLGGHDHADEWSRRLGARAPGRRAEGSNQHHERPEGPDGQQQGLDPGDINEEDLQP